MNIKVWRLRIIHWLLLLAIGLQGLGPAFAGLAFSSADNRLQIVVCTSAGMVIMDLPALFVASNHLTQNHPASPYPLMTAPANRQVLFYSSAISNDSTNSASGAMPA